MKFKIIPVTSYVQNCSLLWCEKTLQAAVIDPGGDIDKILNAATDLGVEIKIILATHGHLDHVGGVAEMVDRLKVPVEGPHKQDQFLLNSLPQQCEMFGFPVVSSFTPNRWLQQGDVVEFGNIKLEVYHCPGHTPGHIVFFNKNEKLAFVGDVLFKGSIGRTDFPRGDHEMLLQSIREKLWPLGDEVRFVAGHGRMSTFGYERRTNPFLS
ncbi:MAG: MBL fold metallo-hydrolase [Gammaproteobacteria bacterium]|nr:MBL fold metallo-hydrolase [Gammaproteobacteria bacterium]